MSVEPGTDKVRDAFRQAYQIVTDQIPASSVEWPLLPVATPPERPTDRRRSLVTVALSLLLLGAAFFGGWSFAAESEVVTTGPLVVQDEESVAARTVQDGSGYPNPTEGAIAAAVAFEPNLIDPKVARAVVIFADETTVDLRVEVRAEDFCQWFGVVGRVEAGVLVWRGGPALSCEG